MSRKKDLELGIRSIYGNEFIPLHAPQFNGNEKKYLSNVIDSTFVSSVGEYVNKFEKQITDFTNAKYSIACDNGTNGLHLALTALGISHEHEVITQSLTFVATCNSIQYTGASINFVDVDLDSYGMSPISLKNFLEKFTDLENGKCINRKTKKQIKACIPMHTFGMPCRIEEIKNICEKYSLYLIEDSTEALGSNIQGQSVGTFGDIGVFSFNGNKIITTGGGGMITTNSESLGKSIKHLSTTAKLPHEFEFIHNQVGYNYRMPNLNAALGVAQMEILSEYLVRKENIFEKYQDIFSKLGLKMHVNYESGVKSNYWFFALEAENKEERDILLHYLNSNGIQARPLWTPMHLLNIHKINESADLIHTETLYSKVINVPSTPIKL